MDLDQTRKRCHGHRCRGVVRVVDRTDRQTDAGKAD
jgi:hypothetical protein